MIPQNEAIESVCAGRLHTCASTTTGKVYCWGDNSFLQSNPSGTLGEGISTPALVTQLTAPVQVSCFASSSCAWNASTLLCWGDNNAGQVGDPAEAFAAGVSHVVTVKGLPDPTLYSIVEVVGSNYHVCARLSAPQSNEVWCWGSNWSGQIGQTQTALYSTPQTVCSLGL
jgi:alpha-tubulin suppressor-like RCC1 family protein